MQLKRLEFYDKIIKHIENILHTSRLISKEMDRLIEHMNSLFLEVEHSDTLEPKAEFEALKSIHELQLELTRCTLLYKAFLINLNQILTSEVFLYKYSGDSNQ